MLVERWKNYMEELLLKMDSLIEAMAYTVLVLCCPCILLVLLYLVMLLVLGILLPASVLFDVFF